MDRKNEMPNTPSAWPRVQVTLQANGYAEVSIAGSVQVIEAANLDQARVEVVTLIASRALQLGRPLQAQTHDPAGEWSLLIHPDGRVEAESIAPASQPLPQTQTTPIEPVVIADLPAAEAQPVTGDLPAASSDALASPQVVAPVQQSASEQSTDPWVTESLQPVSSAEPQPATPQTSPARRSFLTAERTQAPATHGFRGLAARVGFNVAPSRAEQLLRADEAHVSQHWPGPRTCAIVNPKGGAAKTPVTILLAAVFARYGGAGVLAWDNNQTRGTLGWRTEQGPHESTVLDLLPKVEHLLGPGAQAADLAHYVHHQTSDRFDVLRSNPRLLASEQRVEPEDVDAIHALASKYYRIIFIDSGNDESDPMWLRMIDHTDQLIVATTTRGDHAEAGALLLDALQQRNEHSAKLASRAVVVVTQADPKASSTDVKRIVDGYQSLVREAVTIPYEPAMVEGLLRFSALNATTQRAALGAAAAVARGLSMGASG